MIRWTLTLTVNAQADDAFDSLTADKVWAALCRGWPNAFTSGIKVTDFRQVEGDTTEYIPGRKDL